MPADADDFWYVLGMSHGSVETINFSNTSAISVPRVSQSGLFLDQIRLLPTLFSLVF